MDGGGAMPRPQHPAESHICLWGGTARLRGTPRGRGKTTPTTSPVPSHWPHFTRFLLLLFLFQRRKTILQHGGWRGRTIPQPCTERRTPGSPPWPCKELAMAIAVPLLFLGGGAPPPICWVDCGLGVPRGWLALAGPRGAAGLGGLKWDLEMLGFVLLGLGPGGRGRMGVGFFGGAGAFSCYCSPSFPIDLSVHHPSIRLHKHPSFHPAVAVLFFLSIHPPISVQSQPLLSIRPSAHHHTQPILHPSIPSMSPYNQSSICPSRCPTDPSLPPSLPLSTHPSVPPLVLQSLQSHLPSTSSTVSGRALSRVSGRKMATSPDTTGAAP